MKNKIKVCSLFSGIGGFETGLIHSLGEDNVEIVFASEIDKYAAKSYEYIYGHKPEGDITKIHEKDIPEHDLLVGGFPCQAFSAAGKRLGFEDTRGTLFFDIARIAKEKQPKYMLLENVKGLLNHDKGRTMEVIVKTLSDMGYKVDFKVLNSKYFDVAQNRERIYIVALKDVNEEEWILPKNKNSVFKTKERLQNIEGIKTFNFDFPNEENVNKSLKDILVNEVEDNFYLDKEKEKKILSNLKGKEENEQVFRIEDKRGGNSIHSWDLELKGKITEEEKKLLSMMVLERRKGIKDGNPIYPEQVGTTSEVFDKLTNMGYLKKVEDKYDFNFGNLSFDISKVIPLNGLSPTVTCTDATKYGVLFQKEQEEIKLEFIGGVPDKKNWGEKEGSKSSSVRQGNRIYDSKGIASTLCASGVGGMGGYTGLYLVPEWRIRKLTPLECFRLQSFPDSYYYILKEKGLSNSRLYKMAGNAVTTNVIEAIVNKLKLYF